MPQLGQSDLHNRLLRVLSAEDFALLAPRLEPIALPRSKVLIEPHEPIEHVVFIEAGIGSVVAFTSDEQRVEVGIVGREGLIGPSVALGVWHTPHQSFIQVEGHGIRIPADDLARAIDESRSLHRLLLRYVQAFNIQVAASAVSNGQSVLGERLARWLLMCHDRIDGAELALTHEFLSLMLAVRRASVTDALHLLEGAGIVRARRGSVAILDRAKLEEMAGDSYGGPEAEYEKLIPEGRA